MHGSALLQLGLALAGIGLISGSVAAAPAIYRCSPNLYSQQPCDGGQRVTQTDPRSPEQATEARATSAGQMKLADRMQRERAALERTRPLSGAVGIGPLALADEPAGRKPKAARKVSSNNRPAEATAKPYKPGGFIAFVPGPVKPKRAAPRTRQPQD